MAWLSAGAESRINCHAGTFIKTLPPNYRTERRAEAKSPDPSMGARGAHAEHWVAPKEPLWRPSILHLKVASPN